jgi:hypothetical protein
VSFLFTFARPREATENGRNKFFEFERECLASDCDRGDVVNRNDPADREWFSVSGVSLDPRAAAGHFDAALIAVARCHASTAPREKYNR